MARRSNWPPFIERFAFRFDVDDTTGCWVWRSPLHASGYGTIKRDGRDISAHRASYELLVGPVPAGLQLDHLCRNRACVNPEHLEPVTPAENQRRGFSLQAQNARKTHCDSGHEFTPENTYTQGGRRRQCRTCNRLAVERYQRRVTA